MLQTSIEEVKVARTSIEIRPFVNLPSHCFPSIFFLSLASLSVSDSACPPRKMGQGRMALFDIYFPLSKSLF